MTASATEAIQFLRLLMEQRQPLDRDQARVLLEAGIRGDLSEVQMASVLGALAARGETAAEIAGFADAMRAAVVQLPLTEDERATLVDTCGTGGDASGTFNISTASALVAAAAGATVAKHGNRAVTSRCGSADVLEALGIPVDLSPQAAADSIRRHQFAFMLAVGHHPAMKAIMPVRKALPFRTVFNILGPLTNPAGARAQVMGVYSARLVPLVAEAMALLGVRHAMVVHGDGCLDELSISGPSQIAEVRSSKEHGNTVRLMTIQPEDLGLQLSPSEALQGGDAEANAVILRNIFAGERGPRRDVVLLNAAAVLVTAGLAADLRAGADLAAETIDQGKVSALVAALQQTRH